MDYLIQAEYFFLVLARTTSFFITAPFFSIRGVPAVVKVALGFMTAVFLFPALTALTLPQLETAGSWVYIWALIKEVFVGLALGFLANLIFSAIQVAGQLLDIHMGLAMSSFFDPQYATNTTIVGRFFLILGLLLFFQLDGHHTLLLALRDSFQYLSLGGVSLEAGIVWTAVKLFAAMFGLALRIASPVIAILLVSDTALSLVARTVPQLNVFILGFPLKAGLGMLTLIAILPLLLTVFANLFSQMEQDLALVLKVWMP